MDPRGDAREWKKILLAAGLRDARLHDARHTNATLLLEQGIDARGDGFARLEPVCPSHAVSARDGPDASRGSRPRRQGDLGVDGR